jgi:hypothetical protein
VKYVNLTDKHKTDVVIVVKRIMTYCELGRITEKAVMEYFKQIY